MNPLRPEDPRTIDEYKLIGFLGEGGMGRVYLGKSPGGRAVAVKIIHPRFAADSEYLERFRHEVEMARKVSGAYTAAVLGARADDTPPWLAIDFVFGPSLAKAVTQRGPLSSAAVWCLAGGMVEALQAVHAEKLVHRDLKPGNVLLDTNGPKVIDFGIAKWVTATGTISAGRTSPGIRVGTPGYMSPQQSMGGAVGAESDVFSLGCVIVYAATGNHPEVSGTAGFAVRDQPGLAAAPDNLRRLVEWCLAPDHRERPTLDQLMTAVVAGRARYQQAPGVSFWPEPLAGLVRSEEEQIRSGITGGSGGNYRARDMRASAKDHPPTELDRSGGGGNGQPRTQTINQTIKRQESRKPRPPELLKDGPLFAAYRPRIHTGGALGRRPGEPLDAAAHAAEGDRHWDRGGYTSAEDSYRASLKLDKNDPVVHVDLGRAVCMLGRYGNAEMAFIDAWRLAPELIAARWNRYLAVKDGSGRDQLASNLHEELAEACRQVLDLDHCDAAGYANLGDALCCLGRDDEAWQAYQAALSIDRDNPRLREKLDYAIKRR